MEEQAPRTDVPDVSRSVTVDIGVDEAFRIFVDRPIEWLPTGHTFIKEPRSITIEPRVGGLFVERGADGTQVVRGTVVEWSAPTRLVMTWRIGANWQPVPDDERASHVELEFIAIGPDVTQVRLTHSQLHRHGDLAATIHAAVDGPGPGDTLTTYARAVARRGADVQE
jgi:uncharacterized protein YndB with AHSA1/START domain